MIEERNIDPSFGRRASAFSALSSAVGSSAHGAPAAVQRDLLNRALLLRWLAQGPRPAGLHAALETLCRVAPQQAAGTIARLML